MLMYHEYKEFLGTFYDGGAFHACNDYEQANPAHLLTMCPTRGIFVNMAPLGAFFGEINGRVRNKSRACRV